MAQHLTEEEQIATLKRWWADNGRSIVVGVTLAVAGYFGWQAWQSSQQEARETASALYEDLADVVVTPPGESLNEAQRKKAADLAETLKSDYGNLLYASNAALLMAKVAVDAGDLEQAEAQLRWVLARDHSDALSLLARLRLASVLYGQSEHDQALATLDVAEPGAYQAAYAELRGDILVAQGQAGQAKGAYETALETLLPAQSNRRDIIRMKLDDILAGEKGAGDVTATQAGATEADDAPAAQTDVAETDDAPAGQTDATEAEDQ